VHPFGQLARDREPSKTFVSLSFGSPGPLSVTVRPAVPLLRAAPTVTCVPVGVCRSALSSSMRMI
jgi:hypothetical protein